MFENGVLRRIFGPKRDEVTGEWIELNTEELNDLYNIKYYSAHQIENNEMGGARSKYGVEERRIQSFGGET